MTADIVSAVRQMLLDDIAISDLVDNRIYAGGVPHSVSATWGNEPPKAIALSRGGSVLSAGTASYIKVQRLRLDVRCYGEDLYEAGRVHRLVEAFMKAITPQTVNITDHQVYVHNAVESAGGIDLVDPDTDWPSVASVWGVHASEEEIAAPVVSS